jgi:protein TonB
MIAALFTGIIFILTPLLTKIQRPPSKPDVDKSIFWAVKPPPPLPDVDRDKKEPEKPREMTPKEAETTIAKVVPEIPRGVMPGADIPWGLEIADPKKVIVIEPRIKPYDISEVDQKPRLIRSVQPQYPFLAKQKNIEGKVLVRFTIDKDGYPRKPEVYTAEPEGYFEEAALKAIMRYKFQPATKDGLPVDCIAIQPINFGLR